MAFLFIFFFSCLLVVVTPHGRLIDPPSRSSMWRFGFETPHNYNDHELSCGGFKVQWQKNKGKCGVCGDPYDSPEPRDNEAGGKYGNGIIVKTYKMGQIIKATADLTANHLGYFEFRICPQNNVSRVVSQDCLDRHVLELENTADTKFYLQASSYGKIDVYLKLPTTMTCTQCVLQWQYIGGNNWGKCKNGTGGLGCGPQESFRSCSDVSIEDENAKFTTIKPNTEEITKDETSTTEIILTEKVTPSTRLEVQATTTSTKQTDSIKEAVCGVLPSKADYLPGLDKWCKQNCEMGNCPSDLCICTDND